MRAYIIKTNGTIDDLLGKDLPFPKIQEACGGYVERLTFPWGEAWMNENGIAEKLPTNQLAYRIIRADVVGNVVLRVKKGYELRDNKVVKIEKNVAA